MNILLTNDDGVDSNITLSLLKALEEDGHNVTLIAPSKDKSGQGAAITPVSYTHLTLPTRLPV